MSEASIYQTLREHLANLRLAAAAEALPAEEERARYQGHIPTSRPHDTASPWRQAQSPPRRCPELKIRFEWAGSGAGRPLPMDSAASRETSLDHPYTYLGAQSSSKDVGLIDDPEPGAIGLAARSFRSGTTREPGGGERQPVVAQGGANIASELWSGGQEIAIEVPYCHVTDHELSWSNDQDCVGLVEGHDAVEVAGICAFQEETA